MKRIVALLVSLVLILSMAPAAHAYEAPVTSSNKDGHFYVNAQRWYTPIYSVMEVTETGYARVEYVGDRLIAEQCNTYYVRNLMQPGGMGHGQFVVLDQYLANKGTTAWVVFSFIETDGAGNFIAEYSNIPMMITCDIVDGEFVITEVWVEEKG